MTGAALLTLVATVLTAEGMAVEIDLGTQAGIRVGDRGAVFYEVGEGDAAGETGGLVTFEVGVGEVLDAGPFTAWLLVDPEAEILPGYSVRLEIPAERLTAPMRPEPPGRPPEGPPARGRYVVSDRVTSCVSLRPLPSLDTRRLDCLPPGTRVAGQRRLGAWMKVGLEDGREGWVTERFLSADSGRRPPPLAGALRRGDRNPSTPGGAAAAPFREAAGAGDPRLRSELEESRSALAAAQADRRSLERRLAAAEHERNRLGRQVARLRQRGRRAPSAVGAPREEVREDRKERAAELQRELARARQRMEKAERARQDLQGRLEAAILERGALSQQVDDLEAQRGGLEAELQRALGELNGLRQTSGAAEAELKARLEESVAARADQEQRLEFAQRALAASQEIQSRLARRLDEVFEELDAARVEVAQLRTSGLDLAASLERERASVARLELRLKETETAARRAESQRAELDARLAEAVGERDGLRQRLAVAEEERSGLMAELDSVRARLAEVSRAAASVEGDLEARLRSAAAAEDDLAEQLRAERETTAELQRRLSLAARELGVGEFVVGERARPCLRVRERPLAEAAVSGCLPAGTVVEVLDLDTDWKRVRSAEGQEGWVAAAYLESVLGRRLAETERDLESARAAHQEALARLAANEAETARKLESSQMEAQQRLEAGEARAAERLEASEAEAAKLLVAERAAAAERLAAVTAQRDELQARAEVLDSERETLAGELEEIGARLAEVRQQAAATELDLASEAEKSRETAAELERRLESAAQELGVGGFVVSARALPCLRVHDEPAMASAASGCLPAGTPVAVVDLVPDWRRVRPAEGTEGWVAAAYLESDLDRRLAESERALREARSGEAQAADRLAAAEVAAAEELAAVRAEAAEKVEAARAAASEELAAAEAATKEELAAARAETVERLDSERAAAAKQLAELAAERDALQQRAAGVESERQALAAELEESQAALAQARQESAAAVAEARQEAAAAAAELEARLEAERQAGAERAAERLAAVTTQRDELQARAEVLDSERETLAGELEEIGARLAEVRQHAAATELDLTSEVKTARETAAELERRLELAARELGVGGFVVGARARPCLRVRDEPAMAAAASGCLPAGTAVAVVDLLPDWRRVRTAEGTEGWVAAAYLESEQDRRLAESERAEREARSGEAQAADRLAAAQAAADEKLAETEAAAERLESERAAAAQQLAGIVAERDALQQRAASLESERRALAAELEESQAALEEARQEAATAAAELEARLQAERQTGVEPAAEPADRPPPDARKGVEDELRELVDGWAAAWSRQDVAGYLAHYSQRFRPGAGMSRSSWEALRRQRLTTPGFIDIEVSGFEAVVRTADAASLSFVQHYASDVYSDTVTKRLEVVREEDGWKILRERQEP